MAPQPAESGPTFGFVTPGNLGLFTDLYELTMAQGYLGADHAPTATFSLFVRELPPNRGYLVAAGLEQVVAYLETVAFGEQSLAYLSDRGFEAPLLDWLADFEFTGDVRAVPEGTPVFADEPVLEVTAPIPQAQLFETLFINQVGYQTLVATKAARMRDVVRRCGDGQSLVDFGSRRAHGTDAGVKLARAAAIGGFEGTSNVAAGELFDLPVYGTMAHSWVQSFETERAAFEAFVERYGEESILLVDTYDTLEGVDLARSVADELGVDVAGVRLDSGDLVELSKAASERLDGEGVFVSSGMDEYAIEAFLESGGVATGFGPGTALATNADAPALELVYKLVEVERDGVLEPTMKHSEGKQNLPGRKSIRRVEGPEGYERDVVDVRGAVEPDQDLLTPVYEDGSLVHDCPPIAELRERVSREVKRLPAAVRSTCDPDDYPVEIGPALRETVEECKTELS